MKFERNNHVYSYSLTLAHPWHGISPGENAPETVSVFIEIVTTDTIKYEVDKISGHMMVDRPQKFSNYCPTLYGFVPQTLCGDKVAAYTKLKTGKLELEGDQDPIDICVLTERPINHGAVILQARPIGGFRLFDGGEADDKILAVLVNDPAYSGFQDISDVPAGILDRLKHYFLTYKQSPDTPVDEAPKCVISHVYGRDEARDVIRLSMEDYQDYIADKKATYG
jgi:inorganic pyrophosphatase